MSTHHHVPPHYTNHGRIMGNVYKLAFWAMAYMVFDKALLQQIRDEVTPAVHGDSVDETHLLENCPKLSSLLDETLRLIVNSSLARVIIEPTVVGGKLLQPGNKIMVNCPYILRIDPLNRFSASYQRTPLRSKCLGSRSSRLTTRSLRPKRKAHQIALVPTLGRRAHLMSWPTSRETLCECVHCGTFVEI